MTIPPEPRRRDDPRMHTVEMEALGLSDLLEAELSFGSGPVRKPLPMWKIALLVALGGAIGAMARQGIALAMPTLTTPTLIELPRATLLVNVLGCMGLGVLTGILEKRPETPQWVHPLVGAGLLGGFTTFSAVVLESSAMMGANFPALSFAYGVTTALGAIGGAVAGLLLGLWLGGRGGTERTAAEVRA